MLISDYLLIIEMKRKRLDIIASTLNRLRMLFCAYIVLFPREWSENHEIATGRGAVEFPSRHSGIHLYRHSHSSWSHIVINFRASCTYTHVVKSTVKGKKPLWVSFNASELFSQVLMRENRGRCADSLFPVTRPRWIARIYRVVFRLTMSFLL